MNANVAEIRNQKPCLPAVILLLAFHSLFLGWSITWLSPTLNEPGHLAAGVAIWELGRFDVYRVNPPLVRAIAAIPAMTLGCRTNWDRLDSGPGVRCEFNLGIDFVRANGLDSILLFTLARWACIPFSVLGGWCCYLWGRDLGNGLSGLLACGMWCFNPTVLATGQVIAPDMGGAALQLLSSYLLWQWLKSGTWWLASGAGFTMGIAILAKSTWVQLFAIWPLLAVVVVGARAWRRREVQAIVGQAGQLTWILCVAAYVVNIGYLFDNTMTPLGDFEFVSQKLGNPAMDGGSGNVFRDGWMARIPIPLPREFILGIDHQKRDFENFPFASYLRGEWRKSSWWYYYLYGFVVKLPVGTMYLLFLAVAASLFTRHEWTLDRASGWAALSLPGLITLLIVSSQPTLNHNFRYTLPVFGPLFVFLSTIPRTLHFCSKPCQFLGKLVFVTCLTSAICSTIIAAPGFIGYFNAIAGGHRNGHRHLIHSNLDWGQDLYYLKKWIEDNQIREPIYLAYHGLFDPSNIGIDYIPAHCGPAWNRLSPAPLGTPGIHAISMNYVIGDHWWLRGNCDYLDFRDRTPIHICGDSILIYKLP